MDPLPSVGGSPAQGRAIDAGLRCGSAMRKTWRPHRLASRAADATLHPMQDDPPMRLPPEPPPERPDGHLSYVLIALALMLVFWWTWG